MYFVKTPAWLKKIYPNRLWHINTQEKILYLSFDDGPHPVATAFVLATLKEYNAKATFFCIGKNAEQYPDLYLAILKEGHTVGNHTQDHLNGWKTGKDVYLDNVKQASHYIQSGLFRPPYGRIKRSQAVGIAGALHPLVTKTVMWDILSGDFDTTINAKKCTRNVTANASPGSIIVFHDSEKAWPRLEPSLPAVLEYFSNAGYRFEAIK